MPPRGRQLAGPGPTRPLRIGTHNVQGLTNKDEQRCLLHAQTWDLLHLDVVLIQESWLPSASACARVEALLAAHAQQERTGPWRCYWGMAEGCTRRGVGILIRERLIASGAVDVTVLNTPSPPTDAAVASTRADECGRLLALRVRWAGHNLQLASLYLPTANEADAQRAFIARRLAPLHDAAARAGSTVLWGGDFNFVENTRLDRDFKRIPAPGAAQPAAAAPPTQQQAPSPTRSRAGGEEATAKRLHERCKDLSDVFRHLHPECKTYTRVMPKQLADGGRTVESSRIDRFYLGSAALRLVRQCHVPTRATHSDHRVLVMELLPATVQEQGSALAKRARLAYAKHDDLTAQVDAWLHSEVGSAPLTRAPQLRAWYPGFKQRWLATLMAANREAAARATTAAGARAAAAQNVDLAAAALEAYHDAAAMQRLKEAERLYQKLCREHARLVATAGRHAWIDSRETPSPTITRMLQPPRASRTIPALADPASGQLVHSASDMAELMAAQWSAVSREPADDPGARTLVLAALAQHGRTMSVDAAATAGAAAISSSEVAKAIKAAAPGRSPGIDGLPADVYRKHREAIAPLLSALFTSIGETGAIPEGFTQGATVFIHKGKNANASVWSNYRPITLLNADYRLLARVLATRMAPAMAPAISSEQTAFLPQRGIGAAVQLLQLLPELLRRQGREAVAVFVDFQKAFDTVSRPFLYQVMLAVGAGEGLVRWARTLLTDTRAAACVNGHLSAPAAYAAGVRQGCPLSPLLYLFLAEALLAWLKQCGFGIDTAPDQPHSLRLAAVQYADDTTALLRSLSEVPAFASALEVFGAASGQRLNASKTQVLRIGALRQPTPERCPFAVVTEAETLGIPFRNTSHKPAELRAFWERKLAGAKDKLDRVARLPLSAFGRSFAAGAYGLSRLLYYAEFMGLPTGSQLSSLRAALARATDGRKKARALTGISAGVMEGSPKVGGFGLLPLDRHVAARQAKWAIELAIAPMRHSWPPPPWILVARELLSAVRMCATPLCLLSQRASDPRRRQVTTGGRPVLIEEARFADDLRSWPAAFRLFSALDAYPLPRPISANPPLGAWVADAPICGNPLIPPPTLNILNPERSPPPSPAPSPDMWPLEWYFPVLLRRVTTVGEVVALMEPDSFDNPARWESGTPGLGSPVHAVANDLAHQAVQRAYYLCTPAAWRAECRRPPEDGGASGAAPPTVGGGGDGAPPRTWAAEAKLVECLGFVNPVLLPGGPVRLADITVKQLTALLPSPAAGVRAARLDVFISEASAPTPAPSAQQAAAAQPAHAERKAFLRTLKEVWSLPWDNAFKEALWRLALDCFSMFGHARYGRQPQRCICGCDQPVSRSHCFFECPVAEAVVREIQRAMPAGSSPLTRRHLWLLEPPPGVHAEPWRVVALAAICAMDKGRRALTRLYLGADQRQHERQYAWARLVLWLAWPLPWPGPRPRGLGRHQHLALTTGRRRHQRMTALARAAALVIFFIRPPSSLPRAFTSQRPPASGTQVLQACIVSSEAFWFLVSDFAAMAARDGWPRHWPQLPHSHPIFYTECDEQGMCLRVHARPAIAAPVANSAATLPEAL